MYVLRDDVFGLGPEVDWGIVQYVDVDGTGGKGRDRSDG